MQGIEHTTRADRLATKSQEAACGVATAAAAAAVEPMCMCLMSLAGVRTNAGMMGEW